MSRLMKDYINRMPNNEFISRSKHSSKSFCDKCEKIYRTKGLIRIKGKFLCFQCRQKLLSSRIQMSATSIGRGYISIEEVLDKVYFGNINSSGNISINLPRCMQGKKFRIVLVDDEVKQ